MAEEGRAQPIWCRCLTSGMLLCLARYSAAGSVRLSRRRFEYAIGAARAGKEAGRSRGQCRLRAYDLEEAPRKEAEGAAALLPSSVWRRRAVPTTSTRSSFNFSIFCVIAASTIHRGSTVARDFLRPAPCAECDERTTSLCAVFVRR
mmetsp:Transcript_31604/g.66516  ORF Transcript_31604/g.66516 Transcript_31604/m.66516 type:complete len:147 (+) Transcript_31604:312-752(+)